jgi:hypothetical protein
MKTRSGVWAQARHAEAVHVARMLIRAAWLAPTLIALGVAAVLVARTWLLPVAAAWVDRRLDAAVTRTIGSGTPDLPQLPDLGSIRDHLTGGTK